MSEGAIRSSGERQNKRYRRGTHRVRTPIETCRIVEPHRKTFGITRVADVTGLDRIGVPVAMAVRPNARSLSVSQGKGVDRDAARASALMESIRKIAVTITVQPTNSDDPVSMMACVVGFSRT